MWFWPPDTVEKQQPEDVCYWIKWNEKCHGYVTVNGMKIYDDYVLRDKVLVTSSQTAVDVDYLVELQADVEISWVNFEGAAKKFNHFHSFNLTNYIKKN